MRRVALVCFLIVGVSVLPATQTPGGSRSSGFVLNVESAAPPVVQVVPDCSSGCDGPTGEAWSSSQQACLGGVNTSCGGGCTCYYGFLLSLVGVAGESRGVPRWFHISFATGSAVFGEPGPLSRHRVDRGDSVYRLNGRTPTREQFVKYTARRPARYAEARWDSRGRLHLRLWR